ncbi:MAG TPA: amidohydrolase family protein [Candidatus Baltobacteraceae bacterium]|nr:amidohydrolase family protein [Candidatus Baltobacteraceae bacterium]
MLALAGGTVYVDPLHDPIANGTVLLEGGTILAAGHGIEPPTHARVLDCSGATVAAGFWNAHVHLFERKWANAAEIPAPELAEQLQSFTRYGFTSVFDLGSSWRNTTIVRDRIASGEVDGPAIYSTGEIVIPPGALPPEAVLRALGTAPVQAHEIDSAEQGTRAAQTILAQGTDALKVFASGNAPAQKLAKDAFHAAVRQAHELERPVFAHVNDADDVLAALDAGVDVVAHTTPRSGAWDSSLTQAAKRRDAALTPTLAAWPHLMRHDRAGLVRHVHETAVAQLRAWLDAGAAVLFGTDVGAVEADPAPEFAMMREAGMTFAQILDSLTTAPAKRFARARKCGRIAAGYEADVTVFLTPFEVRYTIRGGRVVYQREAA